MLRSSNHAIFFETRYVVFMLRSSNRAMLSWFRGSVVSCYDFISEPGVSGEVLIGVSESCFHFSFKII